MVFADGDGRLVLLPSSDDSPIKSMGGDAAEGSSRGIDGTDVLSWPKLVFVVAMIDTIDLQVYYGCNDRQLF